MSKLTQERLKKILHYNSGTGIFTRLKTVSNNAQSGSVAGNINKDTGYRIVWIDNKPYTASRLAWLYVEGYFPEHEIDHKNRIRHDNRWENLRHVSHQCNSRNCNIQNNNTSGITGVSWCKKYHKWKVRIMISGKSFSLGYYNSKTDAASARWQAEVEHGFPSCNTTSSAYLYIQKHTN